jgi:hypothetical protein
MYFTNVRWLLNGAGDFTGIPNLPSIVGIALL